MSQKGFAKLRHHVSKQENSRNVPSDSDCGVNTPRSIYLNNAAHVADDLPRAVVEQAVKITETLQPQSQKSRNARSSARCSIIAAAFCGATNGAVRKRLKVEKAIAVVILVPGSSWIDAVRNSFVTQFGECWYVVPLDAMKTAKDRAERSQDVALYLSRGQSVVGVAVDQSALPTALVAAADLTIRIVHPRRIAISRAIRMFTGMAPPNDIDESIAIGLELHDIVAAFRAGSSPVAIIERLKKARPEARNVAATECLPKLEDAIEYGAARTWGLSLVKDLADYRAGRLQWREVDRGAVLFSEPGLGKTLFARILAQACSVPLVAFSIADLFASSPGHLDSVIKASRAMFERAGAVSPCILFLDEIDALPNRATMSGRNADWWTSVITDFLLSLDNAVEGKRTGIVVIGATNNIKGVDAAVLRPGRLERAIEITRPDHAGALNILRYHLNGELPDENLADISYLVEGSTGAEIMMVVRDARRLARSANRPLDLADLKEVVAPVRDMAPDLLYRISIHEASHAVSSLALGSGVLERCVVTDGAATGGYTLIRLDSTDLITRDFVERRVVVLLCGRAAERLFIGAICIGAGGDDESDLAQATRLIAILHASTGLGDNLIYLASSDEVLEAVRHNRELRSAVERHMQELQARAYELVRENRDAIAAAAEQLRIRRRLRGDDVRRIFDAMRPSDKQNHSTNH